MKEDIPNKVDKNIYKNIDMRLIELIELINHADMILLKPSSDSLEKINER